MKPQQAIKKINRHNKEVRRLNNQRELDNIKQLIKNVEKIK